jgi:hypothetical protein
MRLAAVLITLVGSAFVYIHLHNGKSAPLPGYKQSQYQTNGSNPYLQSSGRMSAKALEKLLDEETLHWAPNHPVHMRCAHRRNSPWDYVCTDTRLQMSFGVDVDGVGVTSFLTLHPHRS